MKPPHLIALFLALHASPLLAAQDSPHPEPRMSYVENEFIRLGVDLNLGGAITWLSAKGGENIVNSMDLGRQIQMSHYAGPAPYSAAGQTPAPHWAHLGWNPIQAGDDFGHGSRTLEHTNDQHTRLYTKCVPLQWPLNNVPAECTFECWLTLDGPTVRLHSRLNNARSDHALYPARLQELPAIYLNAPFHRLLSYTGEQPFTDAPLTTVTRPPGTLHPWAHWYATEHWAALLNDQDWGLGLYHPACLHFTGGFDGQPGPNDPRAAATGYLAAQTLEALDHNITYDSHCQLILGTLAEIRAYVKNQTPAPGPLIWKFDQDRQGWRSQNATDPGLPFQNHWTLQLEKEDPQLISPHFFLNATPASTITIRAAFHTSHTHATLFWQRLQDGQPVPGGTLDFPIQGDSFLRDYSIRLQDTPAFRGPIVELRLDPAPTGTPGDFIRLHSITFTP